MHAAGESKEKPFQPLTSDEKPLLYSYTRWDLLGTAGTHRQGTTLCMYVYIYIYIYTYISCATVQGLLCRLFSFHNALNVFSGDRSGLQAGLAPGLFYHGAMLL